MMWPLVLAALGIASIGQAPAPAQPAQANDQPPAPQVQITGRRERGAIFDSLFKTAPPDSPPRFRISIEGNLLWPREEPWREKRAVAGYVRTPMPGYHHEFMVQVTPSELRSAVVYPAGVPVLSLTRVVVNKVREIHAARAKRRARAEVQQALREYLGK
jgi:hypothetical protein